MLEFILENADPLELAPGQSLNVTLINPAFDSQRISRGYSYPVRVKHTPPNVRQLSHQHRLDSTIKKKYLSANIRIGREDFFTGRGLVEEHTHENTQVTFQNNDLSSLESLAEINLRDLLGTISIPQTEEPYFRLIPGPETIFIIYLNDQEYYGGGPTTDRDDALNELVALIDADYPGLAEYDDDNNYFYLYATYLDFTRIDFGATLELDIEQTFSDARELNMQLYIDSLVATPSPAISFPAIHNPGMYGSANPRHRGEINWRVNDQYITNGHYPTATWEVTYIPFIKLRYLLDLIAAQAGLTDIVFDLSADEQADMDAMLIYNNYALDEVFLEYYFSALPSEGERYKNGFTDTIDLANHVPDWTAEELIQKVCNSLNLHYIFRNNILRLYPNRNQLTNQPDDWTQYTDPGYASDPISGTGVTLRYATDTDTPLAGQLADYITGLGENIYQIEMKPLYMQYNLQNFFNDNTEWKVPYINQRGTSPATDLENDVEVLRLFFDRGQQEDEDGNTYWLGSIDNLDYAGIPVGEFSLEWEVDKSDTGIYTRFWRGWTALLFSPIITRVCVLPLPRLLTIKDWSRPYIYIYHPLGSTRAVVRSIQFKVSNNGIGPAKVEFQKQQP